jgi:hypothetical protein
VNYFVLGLQFRESEVSFTAQVRDRSAVADRGETRGERQKRLLSAG